MSSCSSINTRAGSRFMNNKASKQGSNFPASQRKLAMSSSSSTIKAAMVAPTKIGPSGFGATEGSAQDIDSNSKPKALQQIDIWAKDGSAGRIDAISFIYADQDSQTVTVPAWGNTEASGKSTITIGSGEYLTKLCGTTANNCVTSLTFSTSKPATYGPYGRSPTTGEQEFTIDVDGDSIVAFYGRSDHYLRAIGAYSGPQA
uniref:Uncharacterized protein n=1 Tax=Avena sativa TaxID=4498 RepID=A0ACD5WNJ8_AVESA